MTVMLGFTGQARKQIQSNEGDESGMDRTGPAAPNEGDMGICPPHSSKAHTAPAGNYASEDAVCVACAPGTATRRAAAAEGRSMRAGIVSIAERI
jgi:hypothetical protein